MAKGKADQYAGLPKMMYGPNDGRRLCRTPEDIDALPEGWAEHPNDVGKTPAKAAAAAESGSKDEKKPAAGKDEKKKDSL